MKMSKSPVTSLEVSPAQRKLKQARLPFKILSDVSPKPEVIQTRKRKLSPSESEISSKVGKISKENGIKDELITISDDDSKDAVKPNEEGKVPNPLVKLVDTAIKKKLQKTKKKRHSKVKSAKHPSKVLEQNNQNDSEEKMDVDPPIDLDSNNEIEQSPQKQDSTVETDNSDKCSINQTLDTEKNELSIESNSTTKRENDNTDSTKSALNPTVQENNEKDVDKINEEPTSNEKANDSCCNNLTPKRSLRTRDSKCDMSLNESMSDSKLDTSTCSTPSTPKESKKLQRQQEAAKKKEEREKEKLEREKKRLHEKEERERQKKEKEDQKKREREEKEEAKRKDREEKEEAKKKEREEKERQKELEKKLREEKEEQKKKEKEEKEEQRKKEREAKEEEKRKRQEALELEKQEQELKKKKAAEAFVNFFVPKQKSYKDQTIIASGNDILSSFTIKADMRLAPVVRSDFTADRKETLDNVIVEQKVGKDELYIKSLKDGNTKPESMGKTWPLSDKDDDVMIVEDELPLGGVGVELTCESANREKLRPKLLSFHEDRRPPYWGTWRKTSRHITPRRPFGQDKILDYEVDSADEWEDEAEGESVGGGSVASDVADDDYELDNDVFVPHGYLSDEEATMEEDGEKQEEGLPLSPETLKSRLKHLEEEFEKELKKPTEKLKPRLYGPIWVNKDGGKPEDCMDPLWNYFGKLTMIMDDPTPLLHPAPESAEPEKKRNKKKKTEGETQSPKSEKKKKPENKEPKINKSKSKKNTPEAKRNQMGINSFLKKLKSQ